MQIFLEVFLLKINFLVLHFNKRYIKMDSNLDEKLTLEEFQESFWAYIPNTLITNRDIENNRDWADSVVHDAWRMYMYSDVDKSFIFKNAENILFSIKRYSPVFE